MSYKDELMQLLDEFEQDERLESMVDAVNRFASKKMHPEIRNGVWKSKVGKKVAPFGIVLLLLNFLMITKIIVIKGFSQYIVDFVAYGMWLIIPPTWFFIEYNTLFPDPLKRDKILFDDLKYTQELASKSWAGIVVFISAILVSRYR